MKSSKSFYFLLLIMIITACTPFGRLYKEQPRVTLALPAVRQTKPVEMAQNDSATTAPSLNFVPVSNKRDSIPVGISAEWDSINKENLTTMALDEVVVSASSIRNTAERNGLINIEFVVTVPKSMQQENWMVNVRPVLMRGDVSDSLKELRFTGHGFRKLQEYDYRRYDRFLEKIIPDSINFYRTYINYHSFERYLERLKWYKRKLEERWAIQDAKKRRPNPLRQRFEMFNRQMTERDSLMLTQRHAARQASYEERLAHINSLDSTRLIKTFYKTQKIARNKARKAMKDEKFRDIVRFPFNPEAQLDTVIYATGQVHFLYSQKVLADENSARMKVFVVGNVLNSNGNKYPLPKSDTLTYLVSSMTKFIDKTPRFVRKIVIRDAEANTNVNFYFPKSSFRLDESIDINRKGIKQVHDLTLALMTDPVYIIDSLTLLATSSPEGNWEINGEIAQKRAEAIRNVLVQDFKQLYDSLAVSTTVEMNEVGNINHQEVKDEIPNLPELIKIRTIPEGWNKLRHLIMDDKHFKGNRGAILQIIDREPEPDRREWLIKSQYKEEYAYMLDKLYPAVRAVDFRFTLSRRGMKQDTVYTNEPDMTYAQGVEYLEKRKYAQALEILRPYEDMNTGIAYMSLGYDKAALRIFEKLPQSADIKYMQAVLQARLGNEKQAIQLLSAAVDMNAQMKFRANLDPELSILMKKYNFFKEEDD